MSVMAQDLQKSKRYSHMPYFILCKKILTLFVCECVYVCLSHADLDFQE